MYLGLDPSSTKTGIAVLGKDGELLLTKKFVLKADDPHSFSALHQEIKEIIETYGVEYVGCEDQYGGPDVRALIKQVRSTGVVLAALGGQDAPQFELHRNFFFLMPSAWRKLFQGEGKAHSKKSTYAYVRDVLQIPMKSFTADNDRADAIGIAYATKKIIEEGMEA